METELKQLLDKTIVACVGETYDTHGIMPSVRAIFKARYKNNRFSGKTFEVILAKLGYKTQKNDNKLFILGYISRKKYMPAPPSKPIKKETRPKQKSEGERVFELSKHLVDRKFGNGKNLCNVSPEKEYTFINTAEVGVETACAMAIEQIRALREQKKQKDKIDAVDVTIDLKLTKNKIMYADS